MEKECVDFLKEVLVVYIFPVEAEDLYRKMKEMGYESAGSGWFRAANEG